MAIEEEVVRKDLAAFGIRHSLAVAVDHSQALVAFHSPAAKVACHILPKATSHTHHKHNAEVVATQADPTFEEAFHSQCNNLEEAIVSTAARVLRLRAFDRELEQEAFQVKAAMVMLAELQLKWI